MHYIESLSSRIEIGPIETSSFSEFIKSQYADSKIVLIFDENTHANCFEFLITSFEVLKEAELIVLPAGEENKDLGIAGSVWEAFSEYKISRHDVIINVGGGMITDMGGFIASCYKRGCDLSIFQRLCWVW